MDGGGGLGVTGPAPTRNKSRLGVTAPAPAPGDTGLGPAPAGGDGGLGATAGRLVALLGGTGDTAVRDPGRSGIEVDPDPTPRPLARRDPPPETWAVDGGQILVADARSVAVYATRAATVCWRGGAMASEDPGALAVHLLGCGEEHRALAALSSPVPPGGSVDVNLLRDWGEWAAVAAAVGAAAPGAVVLVDGDLQPDWRIPATWLADLLAAAEARQVTLVGVTKHSSLSRGGAPLVGVLERDAEAGLGPRSTWWAPVGRTRPDVGPGLQVVVARLDPDARFAFRVDLPAGPEPGATLGAVAALCDDAAFPGYPYPLSCADRLAACDPWVRREVWDRLGAALDRGGVGPEVVERAFADRHRLMERW